MAKIISKFAYRWQVNYTAALEKEAQKKALKALQAAILAKTPFILESCIWISNHKADGVESVSFNVKLPEPNEEDKTLFEETSVPESFVVLLEPRPPLKDRIGNMPRKWELIIDAELGDEFAEATFEFEVKR